MAQKVVTIWCEWEMGFEGEVFHSMDAALEAAKQCFEDQGADFEEAYNSGLITFDEIEVSGDIRYQLVGDDSGHDYAIPVSKVDDWYKWMDSEDAELGDVPDWALRVEGDFTFTNPEN